MSSAITPQSPRIEKCSHFFLCGLTREMSLVANTTFRLWNEFMPRRNEIVLSLGKELYSVELYPPGFFMSFDATRQFNKMAAVKVEPSAELPVGMNVLEIPEGEYAIFTYRGTSMDSKSFYNYIFAEWLPSSSFKIDMRPHLAVMGEKYKFEHPDSEEEIWIPIIPK